MTSPPLPSQVTLIFGNQRVEIDRTAGRLVDQVLEDAPRDFAFHRFDVEEMLRDGSAEVQGGRIDEFQIACESVPFLSERYVVRLDRVERVKTSGKAAGNLRAALAGLWVVGGTHDGREVWMAEGEAPPPGFAPSVGTPRRPAGAWVREIVPHPGGETELVPADDLPAFLLEGEPVGFQPFLRARLKGRFRFSVPEGSEGEAVSSSGAARLQRMLEKYCAHPPPGCWLLLTAVASREGELAASLLKSIKKHGHIEKFVTYDDYEPVDWVMREAKERGLSLNRGLAAALIRVAGNDLGSLGQELDKLALAFSGGPPPDEASLLSALHGNSRHSLFWAAETLGAKQLQETLAVLQQFLAETPHEHPVMIGIWARHFRNLCHLREYRQHGIPDAELAAKLKIHPFIARKLSAQAARFTSEELEAILAGLARLDTELKLRGSLTAPLFKDFVHAVCSGRFAGPTRGRG